MTIDVGTGDGRAVLLRAARDPGTLAIGIDAAGGAMAEASRRAAASPSRGGLPNALFVVAAAEAVPRELAGIAGLVTVAFPWGSLLRGCLGANDAVARGVAALVGPGGALELLLAPAPHDGLDGLPVEPAAVVEAATRTFATLGFTAIVGRAATREEVLASGSTWARRLFRGGGASSERPAVRIHLVRRIRP